MYLVLDIVQITLDLESENPSANTKFAPYFPCDYEFIT